jgi:hypothetical protein
MHGNPPPKYPAKAACALATHHVAELINENITEIYPWLRDKERECALSPCLLAEQLSENIPGSVAGFDTKPSSLLTPICHIPAAEKSSRVSTSMEKLF